MSDVEVSESSADWWAGERARLSQLFPQRCDEIIEATADAMLRAEREGDLHMLADAATLFARAHAMRGSGEIGARYAYELLARPEGTFEPLDRAALSAALGVAYESLGRFAEALDALQEAFAAFSRADDLRGIAATRLSMGVVHSRCRDHQIGLGHYAVALTSFETLGDHLGQVRVLNNTGLNYRNLGRHDESLAMFDRAIDVATRHGFHSLVPTLTGGRGRTLMEMGRLDDAAECFDLHSRGAAGVNWKQSAQDVKLSTAELARARGDHATAIIVLRALIPELAENRALDEEVKAWSLLAECAETVGDAAAALDAYKQLRERERLWLDQRANTRMRASALMAELEAAKEAAREEHRLRDQLAKSHAALAIEAADRRARSEELYRQSREDALTGLPNRRDFFDRIGEECRRAERFGQPLCVAIVDVDHFKRINDTYGHAAGDKVLVEVAGRLRSALRPGDIVARLGGEEFGVLLPNARTATAAALCEGLRDAVAAFPFVLAGVQNVVTVSIGVTSYASGEESDGTLARADRRLYRAKSSGRNRVVGDESGA